MGAVASSGEACARPAKIGPNAVTRVIEALETSESRQSIQRIFQACDLDMYLTRPPLDMVDEREVIRLHRVLRDQLGEERARGIGRIAGELTGDYLLKHRIPRAARLALRGAPASLASRILARAIAGNAWTFVGSGAFSARPGRPTIFTIRNCPMCRQQRAAHASCDFYAATFERLYRDLVSRHARVTETACQAMAAPACTFEIDWQRPPADRPSSA